MLSCVGEVAAPGITSYLHVLRGGIYEIQGNIVDTPFTMKIFCGKSSRFNIAETVICGYPSFKNVFENFNIRALFQFISSVEGNVLLFLLL